MSKNRKQDVRKLEEEILYRRKQTTCLALCVAALFKPPDLAPEVCVPEVEQNKDGLIESSPYYWRHLFIRTHLRSTFCTS